MNWYQPFLKYHSVTAGIFWQKLSEQVLQAVFSMIGEGLRVGDAKPPIRFLLEEMGAEAIAEVSRRKLPWPVGYYQLQLAPEWEGGTIHLGHRDDPYYNPFAEDVLAIDLSLLSMEQVQALYGCAAQVVDYSCLERGARQVGEAIYHAAYAFLKEKGETPRFLFD